MPFFCYDPLSLSRFEGNKIENFYCVIFNDIKHVVKGRLGVFSTERDSAKLKEIIYFIINNYHEICNDIKKNTLPTKENFLNNLADIISNN